jgi:preprotein translocase subunit SecE
MNPVLFFRQVKAEVNKVSWPTRKETTASTIAVFIMVVLSMIFMFFADQFMAWVVRMILGLNG